MKFLRDFLMCFSDFFDGIRGRNPEQAEIDRESLDELNFDRVLMSGSEEEVREAVKRGWV